MDEKYLEDLYNSLGADSRFGNYEDFKYLMQNDNAYRQNFYHTFGEEVLGAQSDFDSLIVKKKSDSENGSTGHGDSMAGMEKAATSISASGESGPSFFTEDIVSPTALLNRRQRTDFIRAGGLVMAPEKSRELARSIYEKPVSAEQQERDALIEKVGEDFEKLQSAETFRQRQELEVGQRYIYPGLPESVKQQLVAADTNIFPTPAAADTEAQRRAQQEIARQRGTASAEQFVDQAMRSGDYKALRDIINNSYGRQASAIESRYNLDEEGTNVGIQVAKVFGFSGLADEAHAEMAQVQQERNRMNLLIDQLSAPNYSVINPKIQQDYEFDVLGSKPLKDEISPNQYSGLRYFKENMPEQYQQYQLELSKAADPALFGDPAYNKNNRDYQYMLYTLDRKGSELNDMALQRKARELAPEKARIDQVYRSRLSDLTGAMMATTDYAERQAIQEQINQVRSEYGANSIIQQAEGILKDLDAVQVDFNAKYPDYASRTREQMAKDLLQGDGKGLFQEVWDRFATQLVDVARGGANITGANELEFGQSRSYIRELRLAEERQAKMYQPSEQAAIQPLYRLNFTPDDYAKMQSIKNADMSESEKVQVLADYIGAHQDRIFYEQNPEAGKRNWTWGAVGNQVADVGSQVLFQAALTGATMRATRGVLGTAAGEAVAAEAAPVASPGGPIINQSLTSLTDKLVRFGSIMGTTYASTYQPAYQSALQEGLSVEDAETYAGQIALVNGLTETISPDIDVLKRATKGIPTVQDLFTPQILSRAARFKGAAKAFGKGIAANVVPETLEEVAAAYGEYGIDQLYNINQSQSNDLNQRIKDAMITTAVGMLPFAGLSGAGTARQYSSMMKEQVYQAGLYPEITRQNINAMLSGGAISQEDANKRIQVVNTMQAIVNQLPSGEDGRPLPDKAKQEYAFNRLQQAQLETALKASTDPNSQDLLKVRIAELIESNKRILKGQRMETAEAQLPVQVLPPGSAGNTYRMENGKPVLLDQQGNPVTAPAPSSQYVPGTVLHSAELGDLVVTAEDQGVFTVRLPDGNTETFNADEITDLIRPVSITTPQERTLPAEQPTAEPEVQTPIYVQPPAEAAPSTEIVTVGQPATESPLPEIVSPLNIEEDATEEQTTDALDVRQQTEDGQAVGPGDAQYQVPAGESPQPQQLQEQEATLETESPVDAAVSPIAPEEEEDLEVAGPIVEEAALSAEQNAAIEQMDDQQLYDLILDEDPGNPIRGRIDEFSRPQLQALARAAIADQQARTESAPGSQEPMPLSPADEALTAAAQAYSEAQARFNKHKADLDKITDRKSTAYLGKTALMERADKAMQQAEKDYLKALALSRKEIRKRRRGYLRSGLGPTREDAQLVANYLQVAKIYVRQGVRSLDEFAAKIGEKINDFMRRAWELATDSQIPLRRQDESAKAYLQRLRAWETERIAAAPTEPAAEQIQERAAELRLGLLKMQQGINLLRRDINISREDFNQELGLEPGDYQTYVAALKWNIENNRIKKRTATMVLNLVRENNPKKVVYTEMQLLKMQLANQEIGSRYSSNYKAGEKSGYQRARTEVNNIHDQIKQMLKDLYKSGLLRSGNFTEEDLQAMGRMVNNARTETGLERLADFFQRLIDNSSYARTLDEVTDLQDQLGRLLKRKDLIPANLLRKDPGLRDHNILQALRKLDPMRVSELFRYHSILKNVVDSLSGKDTMQVNAQDIREFVGAQLGVEVQVATDHLRQRFQQALDVLEGSVPGYDPVTDRVEFGQLVDQIMNDAALSDNDRLDELATLRTAVQAYQNEIISGQGPDAELGEIYNEIKSGPVKAPTKRVKDSLLPILAADQDYLKMALDQPPVNITDQQRSWMKDISELDLIRLSNKQLAQLKNVIDNIFINRDFSGAGRFANIYRSQQDVDALNAYIKDKGIEVRPKQFGGLLGRAAKIISSKDMIPLIIADNNREFATKLLTYTGLGDIKAHHAEARQVLEKEIIEPLKLIRKKYGKEGILSPESVFKRGMYAYLAQNKYGSQQERDREFKRRKQLMAQDIALKLGAEDETIRAEGTVEQQLYDQYFQPVETVEQLQAADILSAPEKEIYNLFRDFYDRHKDAFRSVMEEQLNEPFNEVQNYVKDRYKLVKTGLVDASFQGVAGSAFFNERNPNTPSTATLQRHNFNNISDIAVLDREGNVESHRVIDYDFDANQLNNSRAMLEDIYTLADRTRAAQALNDPQLKEAIGSDSWGLLRDNIEGQVRAQMRLYKNVGDAVVDPIMTGVANVLNTWGIRQVLFSLGQLVKQPADIMANTLVNLGADMPMFFQALSKYPLWNTKNKETVRKLMAQSEIALRGKTMGGTNWLTPPALDAVKRTIKNLAKDADMKDPDALGKLIEGPDTYFAKVAYLSYYAKSLKQQGLIGSFEDVDWEKEAADINREARDYAQLMTSTRLNVNSKESQSSLYESPRGAARLLQVLFLPLSSFNMNNFALMYTDLRTLFSRSPTEEQKVTALKSFASRMFAELAFQTVRAYLSLGVKATASNLAALAGITPPEPPDDEEEKEKQALKKNQDFWWGIGSEMIKNMMFGFAGNMGADAISNGINWIADKSIGEKPIKTYESNPNNPANNMGMASITLNAADRLVKITTGLLGPVDKNGNPIELSDAQKGILLIDFLANAAAFRGLMPTDIKSILDQAAAKIQRKYTPGERWIKVGDTNATPRIKIGGREVVFTDEQADYFREQKRYHYQQFQEYSWTERYKNTEATNRAKQDLFRKYGKTLQLKEVQMED